MRHKKNKTTKEDCFNEAITNTNSAGLEGHTGNKPERHQPRRINPRPNGQTCCLGLQDGAGGGKHKPGSSEPRIQRVADGVAHRVDRLKAIGNGQVPAVARLAWEILTESTR